MTRCLGAGLIALSIAAWVDAVTARRHACAAALWCQMKTPHLRKRPRRRAWQHDTIRSAVGVRSTDHTRRSPADSHLGYIEPLARHNLELAKEPLNKGRLGCTWVAS